MSKKLLILMLLCGAATSGLAISPGPKGRLYSTGDSRYLGGIVISDTLINTDWTANQMADQGILRQNVNLSGGLWGNHFPQVPYPNLVKMAGTGYGTISVAWNGVSAPTTNNPGGSGSPGTPVMSIAYFSAGSLRTVSSGRAYVNDSTPCTDGGLWAWYDRTGMFSGVKGTYLVGGSFGWDFNIATMRNVAGSADVGDVNADYPGFVNRLWGDSAQQLSNDQIGDKIFSLGSTIGGPGFDPSWPGQEFPGIGHGMPGIIYYTGQSWTGRHGVVSPVTEKLWYDATSASGLPVSPWFSHITAGSVRLPDGGWRTATWSLTGDGNDAGMGILLTVDKNNDGDAMDADEAQVIFNNSTSYLSDEFAKIFTWNGTNDGTRGMKFVMGPNGHNFLLMANSKFGKLFVLELKLDGTWAGAGQFDVDSYATVIDMGPSLRKEINYDYYAIGDLTGDFITNGQDIFPFLKALQSYDVFCNSYPNMTIKGADCNDDGVINGQDIKPFLDALAGNPSAAPEPVTLTLLGLGGLVVLRRRR